MEAIHLIKRNDGVAILRIDTPDSPVNILSSRFFAEIAAHLDTIARDPDLKACVLSSAKADSFIAGADLDELLAMTLPTQAAAFSREGHALLDRIAASKKPFVAAIHGPALGGGLEVALACHYRLASDDPKTVLALPEVQLGLLPAGGGTQRLIPLVGIERGLPMLLTGQRIRAAKAYKMGLVDALTSPFGIEETAAKAALMLAEGKLSPKRPKPSLKEKLLQGPLRGMVLNQAREGVIAKTRGLYPAPLAILDCVRVGLAHAPAARQGNFAKGQAQEELGFGALVSSPEAKSLIGLFHATSGKKKLPEGYTPRPVKRIGVLGAGLMGEGIASVSISDVPVVLKDVSDETLSKAARNLHGGLAKRVKSGSLTSTQRDTQWHRLHFSKDAADLKGCDLVIEAVFEDLELKRRVLAETEAVLAPDAVYATNTSALPIASIADHAQHPERVLGMHYFSPVPKMPLLEVVVTPQTADWAIATAMATGKAQGKTVIVVKDGPGFYTTRILAPFLNEAAALLAEGASVETIDRTLKDFGFPVGPITLIDEVGLDVAAHVSRDLGQAFAHRGIVPSEAMLRMVEAGYKGRKNGKGFYCYDQQGTSSKSKLVNSEIYGFFRQGAASAGLPSKQDLVDRPVLMMVNEAAYCLQEGILRDATDGDLGAVMGLGFPPIHGGPFRYADALGLKTVVARLEALAKAHGPRFTPAPLLVEMAQGDRRFHVIPAQAGIQDASPSA
ncbi:Fatty acid oxidation complex subunit alpha [compost metagenome]